MASHQAAVHCLIWENSCYKITSLNDSICIMAFANEIAGTNINKQCHTCKKKKKKITCLAVAKRKSATSYGQGDRESTDVNNTKHKQNSRPRGIGLSWLAGGYSEGHTPSQRH